MKRTKGAMMKINECGKIEYFLFLLDYPGIISYLNGGLTL